MYFASEKEESIVDIFRIEIQGTQFEIKITKTFFAYDSPEYAKKHNHAHFEVFFNKECSGEILIESQKVSFDPGSMIIVAPKVYHSYRPAAKDEDKSKNYNLKFMFIQTPQTIKMLEDFSVNYIEDARQMIYIIESIHDIYNSEQFAAKQEIESFLTILLIKILRCLPKDTDAAQDTHDSVEYDSSIFDIESFFESHYDNFPSPADLARHLCVSTRQLDRILKQLFSMSFSAKLALTKTELAKDLLETTDMSIVRISEKLGYNSPASFSASFKKQTGQSPNIYRKNNK